MRLIPFWLVVSLVLGLAGKLSGEVSVETLKLLFGVRCDFGWDGVDFAGDGKFQRSHFFALCGDW